MKFFRQKDSNDSRSRRGARLLIVRLKKIGLFTAALAIVGATGYTGYHSGSFTKIGSWISAQTLATSAKAGFKVKDILVTGRQHVPAEELLTRLSIKQDMPIFGISITEAQKSLAGISWVRDVSISRRLPDKIIVELKERAPAALWQYQKKISLIDAEGVVLTSEDLDTWQSLPLIVGAGAPGYAAELLALLNAEPRIAQELVSAVRIEKRRWDLRLKNGILVKLPEQDSELALRRLAAAEEQKNVFGRNISGIDLRQPEKMIVTPARDVVAVTTEKKTDI